MIHNAKLSTNLNMKKKFILINAAIIYLILTGIGNSKQSQYFEEGVELFNKKNFSKSKILFEKDIVFNPKNEKSYLYLAKISAQNENDEEEEVNLENVLLLAPKNDEAIYLMILLKIKNSDYNKAEELINTFVIVCDSFCSKKNEVKIKLKKLKPEDAKDNN
jgi:hypothetical protein